QCGSFERHALSEAAAAARQFRCNVCWRTASVAHLVWLRHLRGGNAGELDFVDAGWCGRCRFRSSLSGFQLREQFADRDRLRNRGPANRHGMDVEWDQTTQEAE